MHELKDKTYYEILGLERDATEAQIRQTYRELVEVYDRGVDQAETSIVGLDVNDDDLKLIREAYQTLINKDERSKYDQSIEHFRKQRWEAYNGTTVRVDLSQFRKNLGSEAQSESDSDNQSVENCVLDHTVVLDEIEDLRGVLRRGSRSEGVDKSSCSDHDHLGDDAESGAAVRMQSGSEDRDYSTVVDRGEEAALEGLPCAAADRNSAGSTADDLNEPVALNTADALEPEVPEELGALPEELRPEGVGEEEAAEKPQTAADSAVPPPPGGRGAAAADSFDLDAPSVQQGAQPHKWGTVQLDEVDDLRYKLRLSIEARQAAEDEAADMAATPVDPVAATPLSGADTEAAGQDDDFNSTSSFLRATRNPDGDAISFDNLGVAAGYQPPPEKETQLMMSALEDPDFEDVLASRSDGWGTGDLFLLFVGFGLPILTGVGALLYLYR